VSFPPHLLDELARAFARAAIDRLLEERSAREPRQDGSDSGSDSGRGTRRPEDPDVDEGDAES
jgi:hypothetical protein